MHAEVPIAAYLVLAAILFSIGVGAFLIKRNLISIFMSIELMLNAVNLTFVAFAHQWHQISGQIFVFVIMLLNAGEEERTRGSRAAYLAGVPGATAIFCLLSFVFLSERHAFGGSNIGGYLSHATNNIAELSAVLFTKLLLPFEVTSVLILIAILGAVVLARKEH